MNRRILNIALPLPKLSPYQAYCLWNLFEDMAWNIWDVYEPEVLDYICQRDDDGPDPDDLEAREAIEEYAAHLENTKENAQPPDPAPSAPNPDF